jgi:uncharacterized membrane protein
VKPRACAWIRGLGVAVVAVAYAFLAHVSNSNAGASALGVVLAVGPLVAIVLTLIWRSGYRLPAILVGTLAGLAVYRYWPMLAQNFPWLFLLQQAGVYGLLGLTFGRSLLADRVPLCTRWATVVHGQLAPAVARYTRRVTAAWTLFFALMTATLIALFLLAPLAVWSAFANFCGYPLVATMFIGEYLVRGRALPDMQHASILAGVRTFLGVAPDTAAVRRR